MYNVQPLQQNAEKPLDCKTMDDGHDLSLPERLITYALIFRHLRPVIDRLERIRGRRQALKIAAMMFICLQTISNNSSPSP